MAGAACSLIFWSFSVAALSLDLGSLSASTPVLFRDATRSRISRSRAAAWSSALAWSAALAEGVNQPTPMARTTPATNTVAGREHLGIDMAVHPPSRARMQIVRIVLQSLGFRRFLDLVKLPFAGARLHSRLTL